MDNLKWMLERAAPKLVDLFRKPGGLRKKGKVASYASCDLYDRLTFDGCARILGLLDRLGYAREMALRFPPRRGWEKAGISRDIWLEYHYAYFLISLSSLPDLACLLANRTFRLGLLPKHCKPWVIKHNAWVRDTPVRAALMKIEESIKADRVLRNLHLHEGETPDPADLTDSDFYDVLKMTSFVNIHGDALLLPRLLAAGFRAEAKAIARELGKRVDTATDCTRQLFDALLPIYQATEQALHNRPLRACARPKLAESP